MAFEPGGSVVEALIRARSSLPTEAVEPATGGTPSPAHARGRPLRGVLEIPMRTVWRLVVLSLALVGCSAAATPATSPSPSATVVVAASASPSAMQLPSPYAGTIVSPLEGRWATGPIPIAEIKADVDGWIVVAGRAFVSAELTPAAYPHGLALALPEVVLASPAGFEPATRCLEDDGLAACNGCACGQPTN